MSYRIGVMGSGGRMGQMLVREIANTRDCVVAGGTESPNSDKIGRDIGEVAGLGALEVKITSDAAAVFDASDAIIDFTAPAATVAHAKLAAAKGKVLVIGTTGMTAADDAAIAEAAQCATIVRAPNMSLAVNLLFALTEQVAARLGPEFDIEILEIHHRHKVDAPSGTALALGDAAAHRDVLQLHAATARGGAEVGDHTVMFCGPAERIELTHKAASRQIYASGAVRAALWARGRKPGLYGMKDVLGL